MTICAGFESYRASPADMRVITSDGQSMAAHSYVLASSSPVLERMIDAARRGWGAECTVRVLGVSADAVHAFVHFLYCSKVAPEEEEEEVVGAHGAQLLALAHAYRVGWLKRAAEAAVSARLTPDRAVDMLKLARLCDSPRLYLQCARLAGKDFAAVELSDGWRFARRHDAALELELLKLVQDADQRRQRWAREKAAQEACRQLGEAMATLEHIFPDPDDGASVAPCARAGCTCRGLQLLMRHFSTCARKVAPGGCARCSRMLQLFCLHASVCDRTTDQACRVPLCRQKGDEEGVYHGGALGGGAADAGMRAARRYAAGEACRRVVFLRPRLVGVCACGLGRLCACVVFRSSWLGLIDSFGFNVQFTVVAKRNNRASFQCHFKAKAKAEKADKTWRLLVKKVTRAKVMSSLANRKVPEVVAMSWARYNNRVAKLR